MTVNLRKLVHRCGLCAAFTCATAAFAQQAGTADATWVVPALTNHWQVVTALQPDGKLLTSGMPRTGGSFVLQRFDTNGQLDAGFGSNGQVNPRIAKTWFRAADIGVDAKGSIVVASTFIEAESNELITAAGLAVARYLSDGTPDPSFGADGIARFPLDGVAPRSVGGTMFSPQKLLVQPDRKVLLFGTAVAQNAVAGERSLLLARLTADGALDTSFGVNGVVLARLGSSVASVRDLRASSDGALFVVGGDEDYTASFMLKLTARGTLDTTFGVGGKLALQAGARQFRAMALVIQQDGKLIIGGTGHNAPDTSKPSGALLLRLHADGTLDSSFADAGYAFHDFPPSTSPYSDIVTALAIEPSGKILAAVDHDNRGIASSPLLVRFLSNGQLDAKFGTGGLYNPPGFATEDLEVNEAAYLLVRNSFSSSEANLYSVRKVTTRTATDLPVVSITGGSRAIADTDSVAGETVELTATATDADGAIISLRWWLDGTEVGSGTRVQLQLSDGTHALRVEAMDNDGAVTTASASVDVLQPTNPLPRLAGMSSESRPTTGTFAFAARDQARALRSTAPITQPLTLTGYLFPPASDAQAVADVFVYVGTPLGWFMRNAAGSFVPWDGSALTLVPAYTAQLLSAQLAVPVYAGVLPAIGNYRVHVGYRRTGSTEIVVNAESGVLNITAP